MPHEYWEIMPSDTLKEIVEAYWFYHPQYKSSQDDILIPEGVVDVIFNFGSPYFRQPVRKDESAGQWVVDDVFVGQRDCLFKIQWPTNTQLFAIRLNPVHAHRFLQFPMNEITNKVISLNRTSLQHLAVTIKSHSFKESESLVKLCDNQLLNAMRKPEADEILITKALDVLDQADGKLDVKTLSKRLNTSTRSVERQFKKCIGLTPKFYIQVKRLHYFLYQNNRSKDLMDAALDAEYYDQSHFIKEFKKFTGETPKAFFKSPPEIYEPLMHSLINKFNR